MLQALYILRRTTVIVVYSHSKPMYGTEGECSNPTWGTGKFMFHVSFVDSVLYSKHFARSQQIDSSFFAPVGVGAGTGSSVRSEKNTNDVEINGVNDHSTLSTTLYWVIGIHRGTPHKLIRTLYIRDDCSN